VRSLIQQIALEHRRRYGYRRITAELRRRDMLVNRKRVARMMRDDNLLAIQPRRFVVTTNSNHKLEVYLNLAGRMRLTGINQLWVADFTYVRLKSEFVFLAVILDGFSRKVVGWSLDRTMMSRLTVAALERAIVERQPPTGVVHHSDRGFQYASAEYVTVLEKHRMISSMSRPANPYDNASCESFIVSSACTRRWAIDPLKNLNEKADGQIRQILRVQQWSSLWTMRTVRTRGGFLHRYPGTRTQTPSSSPDPFSC